MARQTIKWLSFSGGMLLAVGLSLLASPPGSADQPTTAKPTADRAPAAPTSIAIELGSGGEKGVTLVGRESHRQLLVTGTYSSAPPRDLTREVRYSAAPAGIVQIDAAGLVTPVADGRATLTAQFPGPGGPTATTIISVSHFGTDLPISFPNQIVPIFTKLGCNAGSCHGKSSGQNGFRLSLLGFVPSEDYEHLVFEARGRRLFPAAPERSLLLLKATGAVPHGGGPRMEPGSPSFRLLQRWIAEGVPAGKPNEPTVTRIEVVPPARTLPSGGRQQLVCLAHYTDGSTEDVTAMAKFEPNDADMAAVDAAGLVTAGQLPGTVAVMARYQGQVAVFQASLPLAAAWGNSPDSPAKFPVARNFIDELVFKQLRTLGIPPSADCDDGTFVRRAAVDIAGRLPTVAETEQFLNNADPAKRSKWIDRLLASDGYADYFATKWALALRNRRVMPHYAHGTYLFHDWVRQSLAENKPYDQFVREIVTASGEISENPPVAWYREAKEPAVELEDTAQLFLGTRIQCAHCHHHPYEKWSQNDYFGLYAFFSRVGRKPGLEMGEERIYHRRGTAAAENPRTHRQVKPAGLGATPQEISPDQDPRQSLVDWMVQPQNPFFARALVNRYWKHFLGRGLVEPEDDMRATNPASNPELLDALAQHFRDSHFDLKELVRTICNSRVYQLSAEPNAFNAGDRQSFSRFYPRRLEAEVLLDAVDKVTRVPTKFNGLPLGTEALQLPDNGANSYFLTVFGRPEGASACECERAGEANLAQSLHLINSRDVQTKLAAEKGRAAELAADHGRTPAQKTERLYMEFFCRQPRPEETALAMAYIARAKNDRAAYEDILWALVNTKEFLFNH